MKEGDGMEYHRPCNLLWSALSILPLDMTNVTSDYEFLCQVCGKLNDVLKENKEIIRNVKLTAKEIDQLKEEMEYMQNELEKVKNGDYVSLYLDSIKNWLDEHLKTYIANVARFVVFGLTNDGYFCAYIPDNWDFLQFDTVMCPESPLFGHLVLRWG